MAEREYTFEEIDRHISSQDLSQFEAGAKAFTAETVKAQPAQAVQQICGIYRVVRPILVALSNLPFIPQSWRNALKTFIRLMDLLCPQG